MTKVEAGLVLREMIRSYKDSDTALFGMLGSQELVALRIACKLLLDDATDDITIDPLTDYQRTVLCALGTILGVVDTAGTFSPDIVDILLKGEAIHFGPETQESECQDRLQ